MQSLIIFGWELQFPRFLPIVLIFHHNLDLAWDLFEENQNSNFLMWITTALNRNEHDATQHQLEYVLTLIMLIQFM